MSDYTPQIDDIITLELPDERTRAKIVKLVSHTGVIAELLTYTTASKSHNYRKGDLVPCRYGKTHMNLMGWTVVSEAELERAAKPDEVVPPPHVIPVMTHADIFGTPERKGGKGRANAATVGK